LDPLRFLPGGLKRGVEWTAQRVNADTSLPTAPTSIIHESRVCEVERRFVDNTSTPSEMRNFTGSDLCQYGRGFEVVRSTP
jgi:hypothetical protein